MKNKSYRVLPKGIIILMMTKVLFFLCTLNLAAAVGVYAQNDMISINLENTDIKTVFAAIEEETDYFFFYRDEEIAGLNQVTLKRNDVPVSTIIEELLAGSDLTYKLIDNYIAIVPGRKNAPSMIQEHRINGIVHDADGRPFPGVTVSLKRNPLNAVITDFDGKFTISTNPGDVLQFSFVGMRTLEVTATEEENMLVYMEEDLIQLDDVIVVAYGVTKKESFTGSASVVSTERIAERPVTSFTDVLGANTTGVLVTTTGQPGDMPIVRIRGIGSMNASNAPLYVIDGVASNMSDLAQLGNIQSNPMASINPSDIESMTVLKDAAAASLYGSRAANGVIIITTKQGREGRTRFNLDVQYGSSQHLNTVDMADKDQFAELWLTGEINALMRKATPSGMDSYEFIKQSYTDQEAYEGFMATARSNFNKAFKIEGNVYDFWGEGYSMYPDTDWLEEVSRRGQTEKINFSASGGQNGVTYFASGEYYNVLSPVKQAGLTRYSGRANLTSKSNKVLWFGANLNISFTNQSGPQSGQMYADPLRAAHDIPPVVPVLYSDGTYNSTFPYDVLSNYNPVAILDKADYYTGTHRQTAIAWAQLNIIEGLNFKSTFGFDSRQTDENRWYPIGIAAGKSNIGIKYEYYSIRSRITSSNILNYTTTLGSVHNINALAGWEVEHTHTKYFGGEMTNYQTEFTPVINAGSVIRSLSGYYTDDALLSALGKAEYNYDNKYYIALSFRRDGSSRFSSQSRWGNFYSVSGAWRISKEPFMSDLKWLDDTKLRASYGINGTLPSGLYEYIGNYVFGNDYNDQSGAAITNVENLNLSWEKSKNFNIGLEASAFKGRISASAEFFHRYSDGLLLDRELSRVSGYTTATVNLGAMSNRGFEYSLNAVPVEVGDFSWSLSLNLSTLRNKIESLPSDNVSGIRVDRTGYPNLSWYMQEWAGIDKQTGEPMWYVVSETGEKTTTKVFDEATRQILGSGLPHYSGGINTGLHYKNIELNALFSFGLDFLVYDYDAARSTWDDGYSRKINKEVAMLDNWRPDNMDSDYPILINGYKNGSNYSSRYMYNGDYLKMRNIILTYTIPKRITGKLNMDGVKVFTQIENVFILTEMPGFDPETNSSGYRYHYSYPTPRTFLAGLNLSF
ncbi:MAG: TonB-dependent receptor [Bacteroidales bacterium]|nr:TonB-dependent receptor [Bacteroidales bacterium]